MRTIAPITPQATVKRERCYNQAFGASQLRASIEFPWASNPAGPGYKRMAEIDAQLSANKDPLYHAPDKPLVIAQMVAKEFAETARKP